MILSVSEIFLSLQGESIRAGRVCAFVRLAGCNLRCARCDTAYAFQGGRPMSVEAVVRKVRAFKTRLVEITGGEPLCQPGSLILMRRLLKAGFTVLLETNGSLDLSGVPPGVVRIMDLKTPSTGMAHRNRLENLKLLTASDEVKFVIADKRDYLFARALVKRHALDRKVTVLLSPEAGSKIASRLAGWMVKDRLNARLNLQLHKILWPNRKRGI